MDHGNSQIPKATFAKKTVHICYIFGNVSFQVYPNKGLAMRWRIIRFQTDDAHMRIYAVADKDKYLIHIYQKLKNERDVFSK